MSSIGFSQDAIPETKKDSTYIKVDEIARFPGGTNELVKFLGKEVIYPDVARELGLFGTSVIKFIVKKDGRITNVVVEKKMRDCPECDSESIRVVKLMPNWIPAKLKGESVSSYFVLPVKFSLE